ncbi:MAG: signal peptide peptidase SppA [Alphaproteobacteria bacterium]|nr:signal peptide peptidase SppA [Alphaproteobacteria bacterium]
MTFAADHAIDRRRLKRRLSAWRIVAILAIAGLAIAGIGRATGVVPGKHVARLVIKGVIVSDLERDRTIADLADDKQVRAVIVHLDTPGGTVVGGERLYRVLRKLSEKKPVVAVMGTTATSAGYMVALGADHMVAGQGSVTGSIGVIMQTADVTKLLETLGIGTEAIKSGALKGQPSPFERMTPEAREASKQVVDDIQGMFVDLVVERRNLSRDVVKVLADGRVYTGRQALEKGLVDELGGEETARSWLKKERGIDEKLPARDVDLDTSTRGLLGLDRAMSWIMSGKTLLSERLTLDGLVSVWHPQ